MPITPSEVIWFNGKLVPWREATVHVLSHGLHYGSSIFEGLRAYATERGPAVLGLGPHVDRLLTSARIYRMQLPYSAQQIGQAILDTVRANKLPSAYIRPIAFHGVGSIGIDPRPCPIEVAIITFEFGRYLGPQAMEQGVDVGVSSWRRVAPDTTPAMAKAAGNYLGSILITMEAVDKGFAEGIALDTQGYVSEGSGENVFLVYRGALYTPPLSASILLGITREYVLALAREMGIPIRETNIPREMLYAAEEIFLTGTAAEITPVRAVDGIKIGSGRRGPITARLQDEFFAITSGKSERHREWLTYVG